mgnify:CR=1 FL=1
MTFLDFFSAPAVFTSVAAVFGLAVLSQDKPNEIVRLGLTRTLVSLRRASPKAPTIDPPAIAAMSSA